MYSRKAICPICKNDDHYPYKERGANMGLAPRRYTYFARCMHCDIEFIKIQQGSYNSGWVTSLIDKKHLTKAISETELSQIEQFIKKENFFMDEWNRFISMKKDGDVIMRYFDTERERGGLVILREDFLIGDAWFT